MAQPYLSLEAELHDIFWAEDDDATEVRLMSTFLRRFPGLSLEIGCGSGRLLHPLAAAGFGVEGLELSPDMIALCRTRGATTVHSGDMSAWVPEKPYAALLAPTFTLQLAEDPAATLSHWRTWLVPGGGLYLTLFIPFAELDGEHPENEWRPDHKARLPDGRIARLETRHRLDLANQIIERRHRYHLSDRPDFVHESTQRLRWFRHEEMKPLLADAGFTLKDAFVDFDPRRIATRSSVGDSGGIITYQASARA